MAQLNDDELMALLAELGNSDQELGDIDTQLAMARSLRTPQGQPSTVQAGANQIIPNYAGAVQTAVSGIRGRGMEKDLSSQRQALLGKQTDARKAYGQALLGQPEKPKTLEEELMSMQMPSLRF